MPDRNTFLLVCVVLALIFYLSLYPFVLRADLPAIGPFGTFLENWQTWPKSHGDFPANVLFYLPWGATTVRLFPRAPARLRILIVAALGTALSVSMELSQFYIETRDDDIRDTYANALGSFLGGMAEVLIRQRALRAPSMDIIRREPLAVLLLGAFIGARLFPFVPVIDLHKYYRALRLLFIYPFPAPDELFFHTVCWVVALHLLARILDKRGSLIAFIAAVGGVVFGGEIFIVHARPSLSDVLGFALACPLWIVVARYVRRPARLLAFFFTAPVVMERLAPFHFDRVSSGFHWVPFAALVNGSVTIGGAATLEKIFLYGSLILLLTEAKFRRWSAVTVVAVLVFLCSWMEKYLPGRSAETGDAILTLLIGIMMQGLAPREASQRSSVDPLENMPATKPTEGEARLS